MVSTTSPTAMSSTGFFDPSAIHTGVPAPTHFKSNGWPCHLSATAPVKMISRPSTVRRVGGEAPLKPALEPLMAIARSVSASRSLNWARMIRDLRWAVVARPRSKSDLPAPPDPPKRSRSALLKNASSWGPGLGSHRMLAVKASAVATISSRASLGSSASFCASSSRLIPWDQPGTSSLMSMMARAAV